MTVTETTLPGVLLIEPRVFADERGEFLETWHQHRYQQAGIQHDFVQANQSLSQRGVVRGLHHQWPRPQGKLVQVVRGAVFDVAVDIRTGSPTRGHWFGVELSAANHRQLYIPPGFAHGFQALADDTVFTYLCTDYYWPQGDQVIAWNDPDIAIEWPLPATGLSAKDAAAAPLRAVDEAQLPRWGSA
ncbi:MAG: dTDP-4-dehydrorhamnose 3,5-epimerase [Wenzhouxiangellaceae bacterium]